MYKIYCDGASRSNPGEASIGVSINKNNTEIDTIKKKIGINTNNVAEYLGLVAALEFCVENSISNVIDFYGIENPFPKLYIYNNDLTKSLKPCSYIYSNENSIIENMQAEITYIGDTNIGKSVNDLNQSMSFQSNCC